jgi:hypothetical protein
MGDGGGVVKKKRKATGMRHEGGNQRSEDRNQRLVIMSED